MISQPSHRLLRRWAPLALLALFPAFSNIACGPFPPTHLEVDLVDTWDHATISVEPVRLDFGTPQGRSALGAGWYYDESDRETGETFVWSRGPASELAFHLGWRRDLTIEIECRPFNYPDAPPQTLVFELNGQPVGQPIGLDPGRGRYAFALPAETQTVGRNSLIARYGRVASPAEVTDGSTDERDLAVAWSEIRFRGTDGTPPESLEDEVTVPAGAWADHYVDLPAESRLVIDDCETPGGRPNRVEVSWLGEGGEQPRKVSAACDGGPLSFPIQTDPGLTRVRLKTHPDGDHSRPSGIRIRGPRILSHRAPAPEIEPPAAPIARSGARPNVVIYLVDALRSDRLGVYGCKRDLSPRLDAMAEHAVVFTDVTAQSSWTKAAVASIFTGLWPRAHGVNGPDDRLPDELPTLSERFQAAGYQTGAVVANAYIGRPFGFARGFDHFEFIEHTRGRSEVIHERLSLWLRARGDGDEPFFLYVHTIDPHAPYAPPSPYLETFASSVEDPSVGQVETVRGLVLGTVEPSEELGRDLRHLYDGEVAANDASFGRLLDELEVLGELDDTVVVFTSDHGEAFGEHGSWTHGLDLYEEVLSVPLVVRLPGGAGGGQLAPEPVQHIDLMPTLFDLCSLDSPSELPGSAIIDGAGTVRVGTDRTIFAYLDYWGKTGASALRDGWKLIKPLSDDFGSSPELFRHDLDRTETRDLAPGSTVRTGWLMAQIEVALRGRGTSTTADVDSETRRQLEALGYLN